MKKKKILVVDNHPIILEYMSKFLTKDGYEVRTSEDGLHALDILETWRPDIIFVDLIMPNNRRQEALPDHPGHARDEGHLPQHPLGRRRRGTDRLGSPRMDAETAHHVHESPLSMTGVLAVLAVLSAVGGFLALPHFLEPVLPLAHARAELHPLEKPLLLASVAIALLGLAGAAWFYRDKAEAAARVAGALAPLNRLLANKYYVDEIYDRLLARPLAWVSERVFLGLGDRVLLDGSLNGLARLARLGAGALARVQTGDLQTYVFFVLLGTVLCLAWALH